MTTPHKALLQQALDALEDAYMHTTDRSDYRTFKAAAEALQAALDEPEPEPVAWIGDSPTKGNGRRLFWSRSEAYRYASNITPLYTHSPAVRDPLSDAEIDAIYRKTFCLIDSEVKGSSLEFVRAIEAAHGIKS